MDTKMMRVTMRSEYVCAMIGENRQLVTDELVEFEK